MQKNWFRLFIVSILSMLLSACTGDSGSTEVTTRNSLMGGTIQGKPLSLSLTVTTIAGPVPGLLDGAGPIARFNAPQGVTTDGTNIFVADTNNHTIRKIVIATGLVTTVAGSTGISGSEDGTGTSARFSRPSGLITDGANVFVTDCGNCTIRKMVIATGVVTTLAGNPLSATSTDGTGTLASFISPFGITTDGANLYVTETYNHTIRKVTIATGEVTTIAGSAGNWGAIDGTGASARFYEPKGITTDGTNLFVVDRVNNTIRKVVIATGIVTTLAGHPETNGNGFNDGIGVSASFSTPEGITTDGTNLFVTESGNNTIRKVVIASGQVTTLAGSPVGAGSTDGIGSAASFDFPLGITTDGINLFVADMYNQKIRKVAIATGEVSTFAGSGNDWGTTNGTGAAARFNFPYGITTDGTNLFIVDRDSHSIRKMNIATSEVTTLAGSAGNFGSADGIGASARFDNPKGITTDGTNLFVADTYNHT